MRRLLISVFVILALPVMAERPWSRGKSSQITITTQHDAQVKAPLQQVAFAEPTGKCGDLLTDSLVADFALSGAVVIDRMNFKGIMAEHKLNLGGAINEKTAAKIGKLIGAGSLIFVKVHDCSAYKTKEFRNSVNGLGVKRVQVPTTRGSLKASIQLVNLTTGVTSAARMIDAKASLSADQVDQSRVSRMKDAAVSFLNGAKEYDEYPAEEEMQTILLANAVEQVHRLLFPWTETKEYTFFDDRDCSLHVAFGLMQNGDYDGAGRESQSSLDTCKRTFANKPQILARAYYNRGITLLVAKDFTGALAHLSQAARIDQNKVFSDALAICNAARLESIGKGEATQPIADGVTTEPKRKASQPSSVPHGTQDAALTPEQRLQRLDELKRKKLISDSEYERKRKEILAEL
jgi:hypothetical protein